MDENDVQEHCFELIFAFDEIVALGYRENVNLAQIRTFTEMDSHDEKVAVAMRQVSSCDLLRYLSLPFVCVYLCACVIHLLKNKYFWCFLILLSIMLLHVL